jgi:hypothetical protein
VIPGDELCIALPGCIQCLHFSDAIRVLRGQQEEDFSSSSSSSPWTSDQLEDIASFYDHRDLYADIMPDIEGISNTKAKGICRNGWRNKDCTTFVYDASSSSRMNFIEKLFSWSLLVIIALHLVME